MRTHGDSNAELAEVKLLNVEDEEELQLVELLSRGLDFRSAMEEAEDDEGNPMVGRVEALAGALCEKVSEAEGATEVIKNGLMKCIRSLPVHAHLLGTMVAVMSTQDETRSFVQVIIAPFLYYTMIALFCCVCV
jgi:hypothetical protein